MIDEGGGRGGGVWGCQAAATFMAAGTAVDTPRRSHGIPPAAAAGRRAA